MGIFSLFGKKGTQQAKEAEKNTSRSQRKTSDKRPDGSRPTTRTPTVKRDAQTALATTMKIDAIESEMSSEFIKVATQPGPNPPDRKSSGAAGSATPASAGAATQVQASKAAPSGPRTLPPSLNPPTLQPLDNAVGTTTEFLLGGQTAVSNMASPASDGSAVIEEAAILYANAQTVVVEQMLQSAIGDDTLGEVTVRAWHMLLDLHQITGKRDAFEQLAVDYAGRFETSPPAWAGNRAVSGNHPGSAGAIPTVPFSGKLDAGSAKLIERIRKVSDAFPTLRLEFIRVTEVDAAGCALLLGALTSLQRAERDLVLLGAPELAGKIRNIIEVGRRDATDDAWLLLLELLRLLNREKEFEEASIDYCVTFEVSPPAFVAPKNKVTTTTTEAPPDAPEPAGFTMPAVVEGRIDDLIAAIAAYSDAHSPAIIDCAHTVRVDFNAAGRLLSGLAPLCSVGKVLEFHNVNHLVAELFNVIGLKDIARIVPRKN